MTGLQLPSLDTKPFEIHYFLDGHAMSHDKRRRDSPYDNNRLPILHDLRFEPMTSPANNATSAPRDTAAILDK